MEIVKETEEYQIIKKRNGRYGVRRTNRKWVTGDEKVKILIAEGLLKAPEPKPAPAEEAEAGVEIEPGADAAAGADTEGDTDAESD